MTKFLRLLANLLISISLLAGAGFFGWLFYKEINREFINPGGIEVGSIAIVDGQAERRYDSQTRWGSIKASEGLYNLDSIRTSVDSGAVLQLDYIDEDGVAKQDELVLGPGTYIVLDLLGSTRNIQFVGGDISATGSRGLTVTAGETVIAAIDGTVNLERTGNNKTSVSVTDGKALVTTEAGETTVSSEASLRVDEDSGKTERVEVAVNPKNPSANALLLTYGQERSVDFLWDQFAEWTAPVLEVSSNASFNEASGTVITEQASGSATLNLPAGRWFWRITDSDSSSSGPTLLFTVDQERPIVAISPAEGTVIPFRGTVPEVGIQWRQAYFADDYSLEISQNPTFSTIIAESRTATGASLVQNLDEGTWWWRATPEYSRAIPDEAPRSTGGSFTLERRQGHDPVKLIAPADGLTISALDVREGISFRWQEHRDLIDYTIEIANDEEFETIVAVSDGPENFRNGLLPAAEDNTYFWRVLANAADGQAVPVSGSRSFKVSPLTGSVELLDPSADDIKEVDSYSAQTFLWRSSIPGTARFQLDRITDPVTDERSKIIESLVSGESFTAPLPGEGSYAWNVQILDSSGRVMVRSPEARFRLRSEFGSPVLISPVPGTTVNLVGSTTVNIAWDPSPLADAYKVILRGPDGSVLGRDDLVAGLEREFTLPASAGVGDYSVELSSVRNNPPSGGSGESESAIYRFRVGNLVRYSAAIPVSPGNGRFIDGLDALISGVTLEWSQNPSLGRWTVELGNGRTTRLYRTTEPELTLEDLGAGVYTWKVRSSDGLGQDAPDSTEYRFTIGDIPNPVAPIVKSPAAGEVKDMTDADRLVFEWEESANADFYDLTLYVNGNDIPILKETGLTGGRYVLRNLRILDVGDYIVTIRARSELNEVGLNLRSDIVSVPFSLSLNISGDAPDILTDELQYAE